MLKNVINTTAMPWIAKPALPIQKGPGGTFLRPVRRCGAIAHAYEVVVRIINDPARSANAVLLPRAMAPKARQSTAMEMYIREGTL